MNVLFIGNSYTHFNNMPDMLQQLAQGAGTDLKTAKVTCGGKSLEWHWYNLESIDAVDSKKYDYVVLQDHSRQGVEYPDKLLTKVTDFSGRIRAAGAEPVLYNTWTKKYAPDHQQHIDAAYAKAAAAVNARIAPVGQTWEKLKKTAPELDLYVEDRSHPSILGSYCIVCVFYAVLTGESPEKLGNSWKPQPGATTTIDVDATAIIKKTAWETVEKFKD